MIRMLGASVLIGTIGHAAAADEILIGQTAGLTGATAKQMSDFTAGARLLFDTVNAKGGVNGKRINLITLDDGYSADTAGKNAEQLVANPAVVALFGVRGSDPTRAVIQVVEREKVPLVAPVNGSDAVRESRWVFPVRASYRAEVDGLLGYFAASRQKLVVLAQDDSFGKPLAAYIAERVKEPKYKNVTILDTVVFPRTAQVFDAEVHKVLGKRPNGVIALCNPSACAGFLTALEKRLYASRELRPIVAQLSVADMAEQYGMVKGAVAGTPFVQVMPPPDNKSLPITREFTAAAAGAPEKVNVNYSSIEGWVSATVLVEGLKRAKVLTRQGIKDAMESLGVINIGGFTVEYSPAARVGSRYVDLVSLAPDGRAVR
jgi:ABC-type branched-subunit amino acid transport system substrate-binding protein